MGLLCGHSQMTIVSWLSKGSNGLSTQDGSFTASVHCLTKWLQGGLLLLAGLASSQLGGLSIVRLFHESWFLPEHVFQETTAKAATSESHRPLLLTGIGYTGQPRVPMGRASPGCEGHEVQFIGRPASQTGFHTCPVSPFSVLSWDPSAPHLSIRLRALHFFIMSLLHCAGLWLVSCLFLNCPCLV